MIEGYKFEGPYVIGKDELPEFDGVALIVSEAGEGTKILCVENGKEMNKALPASPELGNWKDHAYNGIVDAYILRVDDECERKAISDKIINRRKQYLVCQKLEPVVDDW